MSEEKMTPNDMVVTDTPPAHLTKFPKTLDRWTDVEWAAFNAWFDSLPHGANVAMDNNHHAGLMLAFRQRMEQYRDPPKLSVVQRAQALEAEMQSLFAILDARVGPDTSDDDIMTQDGWRALKHTAKLIGVLVGDPE